MASGGERTASGPAKVVTLTLTPAIDISSEAETVRHTHKTRTHDETIEPGGGGINVARVLHRLGIDVKALFLGGGVTGRVLDDLLVRAGIERSMIEIADDTRMSLTVVERSTGNEYRFVPEGPDVSATEAEAALEAASAAECEYFVASGSLPRGIPDDFYARLCKALPKRTRFVLDTSGRALRAALDAGGIFLVKPSRGELEALAARTLAETGDIVAEARRIVAEGRAHNVAVTLGGEGAILANCDGAEALPAVPVKACSAVGAGDSFLAGMVYGFATGESAGESFRIGLAAGAAAVLSCGSDLARAEDLKRLVEQARSASA